MMWVAARSGHWLTQRLLGEDDSITFGRPREHDYSCTVLSIGVASPRALAVAVPSVQ